MSVSFFKSSPTFIDATLSAREKPEEKPAVLPIFYEPNRFRQRPDDTGLARWNQPWFVTHPSRPALAIS
jgi:hypothetical protein